MIIRICIDIAWGLYACRWHYHANCGSGDVHIYNPLWKAAAVCAADGCHVLVLISMNKKFVIDGLHGWLLAHALGDVASSGNAYYGVPKTCLLCNDHRASDCSQNLMSIVGTCVKVCFAPVSPAPKAKFWIQTLEDCIPRLKTNLRCVAFGCYVMGVRYFVFEGEVIGVIFLLIRDTLSKLVPTRTIITSLATSSLTIRFVCRKYPARINLQVNT